MARDETVEAVRAAIVAAFEDVGDGRLTREAIIAASGVSSASFYRVLTDHPDVKQLLDVGMHALDVGRGSDPIADRPHAAVQQLRTVIAALVQRNSELREELERRERDIERLSAQVDDGTVTPMQRRRSSAE